MKKYSRLHYFSYVMCALCPSNNLLYSTLWYVVNYLTQMCFGLILTAL